MEIMVELIRMVPSEPSGLSPGSKLVENIAFGL
jgi:hypothetical protein